LNVVLFARSSSRSRAWLLGIALAGLVAAPARAQQQQFSPQLLPQPPKQRGPFVVPMLGLVETFDDNLLFSGRPEADFVTRVSLGGEAGYRSAPFTIDAVASHAGEVFRRHPEFDTARARTHGQLELAYSPNRRLTFNAGAFYLETQSPTELNQLSGLILGRTLGRRVGAVPWVEYRIGQFSTLMGIFSVANDTLDGRFAGTRTAALSFDRRVSGKDTLHLRYERRAFHFKGEFGFPEDGFTGDPASIRSISTGIGRHVVTAYIDERSTADVVTLGWTRELDSRTLLLLRAGPRSAQGATNPELLLSLKRRLKHGKLDVAYSKNQSTALGRSGALDTQSLVATYRAKVARDVELASGPGFYRNTLRGQRLLALRLNLETLWHFSPLFHLAASYSYDLQQADFGGSGHLRRGALQVRLLVSPPQRRPDAADPESQQESD
jgi:hypothetical protein